jgi:hypothetical protein
MRQIRSLQVLETVNLMAGGTFCLKLWDNFFSVLFIHVMLSTDLIPVGNKKFKRKLL